MDLERLTKTQIILLTLLVSFVTSIATGIATVSLMEEAPTDVTRVISRIIEKPAETTTNDGKTIVEQRTVIISEEERIAAAVKKVAPSIVRLYTIEGRDDLDFKGLGVVVSTKGVVVADSRMLDAKEKYIAVMADGTRLTAETSDTEGERGFFQVVGAATGFTFTPATLAPFDALSLGQTVVAVAGETAARISPGVIAELMPSPSSGDLPRIRATTDSTGIILGAPLIDLSGTVVGMPENIGGQTFFSLRAVSGA